MFTIRVETHFHASHRLTLPDGSTEPAHDHDWLVTADVSSDKLDQMGLVMNFQKLRAMIDETVSDFDHTALETIDYFQRNNSSAENVAKYIYERLQSKLPKGVKLRNVRVVEEPGCSATFGE
ncbi:MAG: 6-carboxytetrahydropterin synthase [Sedimentisphaerales bacterium]|nr:6-carboxytetrahydropterin synthase [Sedimentisphaerales bacterium]